MEAKTGSGVAEWQLAGMSEVRLFCLVFGMAPESRADTKPVFSYFGTNCISLKGNMQDGVSSG